ncbi:MAG: Rid family detoxifying hydrolase [Parachlamydiaceae bacterium]
MNQIIQTIESSEAPKPIGPYSQAVAMLSPKPLVFVSGFLPIDPQSGQLANEDVAAMTRRILDAIQSVLIAAGSNLSYALRVEIFCTDLKRDFATINSEYARYFKEAVKPARQTIEVAGLPMGSPVEISCIAAIP